MTPPFDHATLAYLAAGLIWACLLAYTVTGLADYGGGVWDLLSRGSGGAAERRLIARVLAPIWEVNHIWLIAVVVLAFSCFPAYFAWYSRTLHVPLVVMLLGLVCRGAAFVFRAYHPTEGGRSWGRAFGAASLLTPAALGFCLGLLVSEGPRPGWVFPGAVAAMVVTHGALLAAVYLVGEARSAELEAAFRGRARLAAGATAVAGLSTLALAAGAAPRFFARLTGGPAAAALHGAVALTGFGVLAALRGESGDRWLRPLVVAQSAALVAGLAWAQFPYLRYPEMPILEAAAPRTTLVWTLAIFAGGSVLLVPALAALFWVFRADPAGREPPVSTPVR